MQRLWRTGSMRGWTVGAAALALASVVQAGPWDGWHAGAWVGGTNTRAEARAGSSFVAPGYSRSGGTYFEAASVTQLDRIRPGVDDRAAVLGVSVGRDTSQGARVMGWTVDLGQQPLRLNSRTTQVYDCCAWASFTLEQAVRTSWTAGWRGRWGVVQGDWLWYGTAGLAVTDVRLSAELTDTAGPSQASVAARRWRLGWALGAGVERQLGAGWSWQAQWLTTDYGTVRRTSNNLIEVGGAAFPNSPWTASARVRADRLSVGLMRRW